MGPNDYATHSSVTNMLSNLNGWRSLENRRINTCLTMFYKVIYGLVAIPLLRILSILKFTLATCTLLFTDRSTHQSVSANIHFHPYPLFFRTVYQLISS